MAKNGQNDQPVPGKVVLDTTNEMLVPAMPVTGASSYVPVTAVPGSVKSQPRPSHSKQT